MSKETMEWLNTQTLIGFTGKRGNAWHYRADEQGAEPNHYAGAIPVADVTRRLFHWDAIEGPVESTLLTPEGVMRVTDDTRKVVARSDTGHIMGVFKSSYAIHQYQEWLLGTVSNLLGDTLSVGSAGLLNQGATAWVSVEVPDSVVTPEGVVFRPNLLACTSHDGTLATTFQRVVTNVVCDNTMAAGLAETGERIKVKHTRYSGFKLDGARAALNLMSSIEDDFRAEVTELCSTTVTDRQWSAFLDAYSPIPVETGRGRTQALNRQDALRRLWSKDARVEPWNGTAWGVVQAVNTYVHHEQTVRGAERQERNMLRAVSGKVDELDGGTLGMLTRVLASV